MASKKKIDTNTFYIEYGIDVPGRRVFLDEEVDEVSMGWIMRAIQTMIDLDSTSPISVFINSFGSCL